jgi:hypothetical protein
LSYILKNTEKGKREGWVSKLKIREARGLTEENNRTASFALQVTLQKDRAARNKLKERDFTIVILVEHVEEHVAELLLAKALVMR